MALTYTWQLKNLKKTSIGDYKDLVIGTQWDCTGTDENGDTGTFNGATPFKAEDVIVGDFIPFSDLTQDIVLGWVQNAVSTQPGYQQHIDEQIMKQIEVKKYPVDDVNADVLPVNLA